MPVKTKSRYIAAIHYITYIKALTVITYSITNIAPCTVFFLQTDLEIIPVHRVEEAIQAAFEDGFPFLRIPNIVGRSKL